MNTLRRVLNTTSVALVVLLVGIGGMSLVNRVPCWSLLIGVAIGMSAILLSQWHAHSRSRYQPDEHVNRLALAVEVHNATVRNIESAEGACGFFRPFWLELLGYRDDEVPKEQAFFPWLLEQVDPDYRQPLEAHYGSFLAGKSADYYLELKAKHRQGKWIYLRCRGQLVPSFQPGQVSRVIGVMLDITAEKQTQDRYQMSRRLLREQGKRLAGIIEIADEAIISISAQGVIQAFNPAAERIFGYTAQEVYGQNVSMLMPAPYRQRHDGYIQCYLDTGVKKIIGIGREVLGRRKDGSTCPLELSVTEVETQSGVQFIGILRDISLRRNVERHVLEVVTQEQRKTGQELHDSVGQALLGTCLLSERLANSLRGEAGPNPLLAEKIAIQLRETLNQVRALSRGLIPVEVDANGFMVAVQSLADHVSSLGLVECCFDCPEPISMTNNTAATHLYRIAQEAVSNALKHARAKNISISFRDAGGVKVFSIQDDGVGLAAEEAKPGGMGLHLMKYRAGLIGGQLSVTSSELGGTVVSCYIPEEFNHGDGATQTATVSGDDRR